MLGETWTASCTGLTFFRAKYMDSAPTKPGFQATGGFVCCQRGPMAAAG